MTTAQQTTDTNAPAPPHEWRYVGFVKDKETGEEKMLFRCIKCGKEEVASR